MSNGLSRCPACDWARRNGVLRQHTRDGCPLCVGQDDDAMLAEIAIGIEGIDADEADREILRVALEDLIADRPEVAHVAG